MSGLGKVLVTGGGGRDRLQRRRTSSCSRARRRSSSSTTSSAAGARTSPGRAPTAPSSSSRATSATATLVRELMQGVDVAVPPGRDPHHAVRRGAAARARGPRRRHATTSFEAAVEAEVRKVVASSSASVYGLADEFPTTETPPPVRQRHALRRREGLQRGPAAQLPRDVRPRLRRAALLQRLRPADGRARPLHRGARPLDGAHLRRPAAADPRRRPADDGLRLHRRHRPRQPARRRRPTRTDAVYNVASGIETSLLELAEMLLRVMGSDLRGRARPARAVNGVTRRLADTELARERARLRGRGRPRGGPHPPRRVVARASAPAPRLSPLAPGEAA